MTAPRWTALTTALVLATGSLTLAAPATAETSSEETAEGTAEENLEESFAEVTLEAGRKRITYGQKVRLTGAIDPAAEGETVSIVDGRGEEVARATTDGEGAFAVRVAPERNTFYRAQWLAAISDEVRVRVAVRINVSLRRVRLFDRAVVRGRIAPANRGARVRVIIRRGSSIVRRRAVRLRDGKRFSTRIRIAKPGSFRAVATFNSGDHARTRARTGWRRTSLPSLGPGSRGVFVNLLERRLKGLGYHITGVDRRYDHRTRDAIIAFNKVQGRARSGSVTASTWRALASPRQPQPRREFPNFHIEIDQTKQVVYTVREGKVRRILHTSTGRNGYTRNGTFTVHRRIAGYSPGRLYYPSYFDALRATHGWPEVPTYPASSGCARIPMWAAKWMYSKATVGTVIHIYH